MEKGLQLRGGRQGGRKGFYRWKMESQESQFKWLLIAMLMVQLHKM